MKNAAGHPVPPSAPTLTPLYTQLLATIYQKISLKIRWFFFAYKVGLGNINYLMTQHASQYIMIQNICQPFA